MKEVLVNKCLILISKNQTYSDIEIAEMKYGLEGLYLTLSKLLVISILAIICGVFKYFLLFTLFYIPIKSFSFGLHANKSWQCWIVSTLVFVGLPYLSTIITIPITIKYILLSYSIIIFTLFAPADTKKRPLVNAKRRLKFKIISLLIVIIYSIFIIKYNSYLSNILLFILLYQGLIINPLGYKLFRQSYNNYKNYYNVESEVK